MTSHSKQEHPFMKHKATFYILVVLLSKYNFILFNLVAFGQRYISVKMCLFWRNFYYWLN